MKLRWLGITLVALLMVWQLWPLSGEEEHEQVGLHGRVEVSTADSDFGKPNSLSSLPLGRVAEPSREAGQTENAKYGVDDFLQEWRNRGGSLDDAALIVRRLRDDIPADELIKICVEFLKSQYFDKNPDSYSGLEGTFFFRTSLDRPDELLALGEAYLVESSKPMRRTLLTGLACPASNPSPEALAVASAQIEKILPTMVGEDAQLRMQAIISYLHASKGLVGVSASLLRVNSLMPPEDFFELGIYTDLLESQVKRSKLDRAEAVFVLEEIFMGSTDLAREFFRYADGLSVDANRSQPYFDLVADARRVIE
jgi:hypothetical protein